LTTDAPGTCAAVSDTRTININEAATVEAGTDQTICSNVTTVTMAATIGGGATSGTWSTSGSGGFNNNTTTAVYTPSANDITNGSITLTYTTDDPTGPCPAVSDTMLLTIKEEVIITTEPQNVGVCVLNPSSLSMVAVGDDLTYQWYYNGSPVSDTANISGSTTNVLSFASTKLSDAGSYYVIVNGDALCTPVTSDTVTLNVNQEVVITEQPASVTDCEGSDVTFTVSATGSIDTYQWYKVGSPDIALTDGGNISGALTASLTLTGISPTDNGDYYLEITGVGGTCPSSNSEIATLTVTEIPTATISYNASPYCQDISTTQPVTISGTNGYTGGTYAAPAGLSIDANTGAITPNLSTGGTYLVTYTIPASGGCGEETATTNVTINDDPPVAICQDITVYLDASGNASITPAQIDNGSNDSCGTPTLSLDISTFDCSNIGANTVTLTATDASGNTAICTSTVTVEDNVPPTALCQDITVQLDASGNASIVAADIDNGSNDACGAVTLSIPSTSFTCADLGANTVTLTVTDGNGNTATCNATVTVEDNVIPVPDLGSLADVTAECSVTTLTAPTATDNCVGTFAGTHDATLPITTQGTTVVTWTYDDGNGNTTTQTQNVVIDDTTAPTASNPADINVQCLSDVPAADPAVVTTEADNCGTPTVTFISQTADPAVNDGTVIRTYRVDDGNGNTVDVFQNVVIDDTTAPTASDPADINVQCLSDVPAADPLVVTTEADNCGTPTVTFISQTADPAVNDGTITRTYRVDDGNGNTVDVFQNVVIDDITAPVADVSNLADVTGECSVTTLTAPTATDNCGGVVTVTNDASLPITGEGTTTVVTWTYDDGNGNTSTQTQNVVIDDITAPVALCQDISVALDSGTGLASIIPSQIDNGSTDNCGTSNLSLDISSFTCDDIGPNTVTLTVDDGNGNSSTCTATVTITDASESATVSIASDDADNTICADESVTFTATVANAGTVVYQWYKDTGSGFEATGTNSSTLTLTAPIANATQVKLGITSNLFKCEPESNIIALTVNATIAPSVEIQVTDNEICDGESVTFSPIPAQTLNVGTNPTYQWYLNGAPTVTTATYTTSSLLDGDSVNLEITPSAEIQCPDPNVATSTPIAMTVNPLPTVVANASDIEVCLGDTVTLTGSGASSYVWDNGVTDGVAFSPSATQTYTVTGTDINGCVDTDTITVTVNPLPTVVANATAIEICIGDSVTLTGSGAISYVWDNGVTDNVAFSPASTTTYIVTGTDGNGCENTDTITVTVNQLPTVVANATAIEICLGESITLTGSGADSYTWDNGVTDGVPFAPSATQTYTVTGSVGIGCESTDSITITVNPLPTVTANATDIEICFGETVTLTGSGALSYVWDNGVTDGVAFSPSATQTYTVTGTDASGCEDTDSITITVNPLPLVSATNNGPVCLGANITLTATFTVGGTSTSAVSWSWTGPNGFSSTDEDPTAFAAVAASSGTYTVQVTDNNGCINTATTDVVVTADATISLSSGSDDQEVCLNDAIADIVYLIGGGGTGATVTGLPAGTSGTYNAGTGEFTISGTPTEAGIFNYTVSATECGSASLSGTIWLTLDVNPLTPGAITGPTVICPPFNGAVYSVVEDPDPNRTHYVWVAPNGVDIVSGQGTNTITVNFTNTADHGTKEIKVRAKNACNKQSPEVKLPVVIGDYVYVSAGLDQEVCVGTTVIQQAGDKDGVIGNGDFTWDDGGAGGSFERVGEVNKKYFLPAILTPGQEITLTITVLESALLGTCSNENTVTVDSMTITVLADPTASISGDAAICEGSSSDLQAQRTPRLPIISMEERIRPLTLTVREVLL
jgi:hypothetical protein